MANHNKAIKISKKHLLGIQDLSISDVNFILSEAKQFINLNKSKNKKLDILREKLRSIYSLNRQQELKAHLSLLVKDWCRCDVYELK